MLRQPERGSADSRECYAWRVVVEGMSDMQVFLLFSALACIAECGYAHSQGVRLNGHKGITIVVVSAIVYGLPIVAACYLLTLATGWTP